MIIDRLWRQMPGDYFCVSTKSASKRWADNFFKRSQLREVDEFVKNNLDKDVYFCPHGFSRPQRRKEYAVIPKVLYADMDEADPRTVKWKPTIAIESSPGRFVGLWLIDRPGTEELNRRFTYLIGADKSGFDLTQVLRVPGTTNYKYSSLPRTRIMWSDGPEYKLSELKKLLPNSSEEEVSGGATPASEVYKKYEKKLPMWCRRELMAKKATVGKRSEVIWKLGNTLIEAGVPREDALVILKASAWNKFAGRRNEDEQLERELGKAVNKHIRGRKANGKVPDDEADYVWGARTLEEIEEEDIEWLWYPYLAKGELTIMEGDPGLGKSYVAEMVSGAFCDGKKLPSVKKMPAVQGKVFYFDIENSAASVTKKRLMGNGIKRLDNFVQEEGLFSIDDSETLEKVYEGLERVKPLLIVFDTVNTYLGKADAFKGHEAQQAFVKFREMAKRFNCAVLVLRHLTKGNGVSRALYRGQGNIAFAGLARVVMTVGVMPDDPETRAIAVAKLNIAKVPQALTYMIDGLPDTLKEKDRSKFEWGEFVDKSAEDVLGMEDNGADAARRTRDDAIDFLKAQLADGEKAKAKLEEKAKSFSILPRTLWRASKLIGVKYRIAGRESYWFLPKHRH